MYGGDAAVMSQIRKVRFHPVLTGRKAKKIPLCIGSSAGLYRSGRRGFKSHR
jgi:hypothetical protein